MNRMTISLRALALFCVSTSAFVACAPNDPNDLEGAEGAEEAVDDTLDEENATTTRVWPITAVTKTTAKIALDATPVAVAFGAKTANVTANFGAKLDAPTIFTVRLWNAQNVKVAEAVYRIQATAAGGQVSLDKQKTVFWNRTGKPLQVTKQQTLNLLNQAWTKVAPALFQTLQTQPQWNAPPPAAPTKVAPKALGTATSRLEIHDESVRVTTDPIQSGAPVANPIPEVGLGHNMVCQAPQLPWACFATLVLATALPMATGVAIVTIEVAGTLLGNYINGNIGFNLGTSCIQTLQRMWSERNDCAMRPYVQVYTLRCKAQVLDGKGSASSWGWTEKRYLPGGAVLMPPRNNETFMSLSSPPHKWHHCRSTTRFRTVSGAFPDIVQHGIGNNDWNGTWEGPCGGDNWASCQISNIGPVTPPPVG
jgi:hypothetical protein